MLDNWFFFERTEKDGTGFRAQKQGEFTFKTLYWSSKPLKALLDEIMNDQLKKEGSCISIYFPRSSNYFPGQWNMVADRRTQALQSVILDAKMKDALVEDIRSFFAPGRKEHYLDRGIPCRRGYLQSPNLVYE
jgi:hypothetical protein